MVATNTQSDLSQRINAAHRRAEDSARESLQYAAEAGRLLAEAKGLIGHGGWEQWIADNCAFSARTARAYMQIATGLPDLEAKRQHVADLSVREALKLLAEPRAVENVARRPARVTTHLGAFDDIPPDAWPRHLFIDAEPIGDGWGVVVRGEDKRIIGRTNKPWEAELAWNDTTGEYRRFVVATVPCEGDARDMAEGLRTFFASPDRFSVRFTRCGSPAVTAAIMSRFSAFAYASGNQAGRRCCSFQDRRRTRSEGNLSTTCEQEDSNGCAA